MKRFRFQDFEIWKLGVDVGGELCAIADQLAELHLYAFADQLRRAALSITNNIAEGSGSDSNAEFKNFLNYARRSVYECANMLLFFSRKRFGERGSPRNISSPTPNPLHKNPKLQKITDLILPLRRASGYPCPPCAREASCPCHPCK